MLTLALLRHAKSSWSDATLSDFDRPLNERGRMAAPVMGTALRELGIAPDLVLCSAARRTRETFAGLHANVTPPASHNVVFEDGLYQATDADMLALLHRAGAGHATVLLIAHNPGIHELAVKLAGRGADADLQRLAERYPTCALTVLQFDGADWAAVKPASGHLAAYVTPRERMSR